MDDEDFSTDQAAISGNSSPSDWDLLTGGVYADAQDPATALDNGTVNNAVAGTGLATSVGTIAPPSDGSSYSPASWLSALSGIANTAGQISTQLAPVIGGRPVISPAQAGQPLPVGSATVPGSAANKPNYLIYAIGGIVLVAIGWFFFRKK